MNSYRSEQIHFTTNPGKGKPFGVRNTVVIEGNLAYKEHADMDRNGKVIHTKKHRLSKKERDAIQARNFVPALWHCCSKNKKCIKTRKQSRTSSHA